jgi:hypothetical protein
LAGAYYLYKIWRHSRKPGIDWNWKWQNISTTKSINYFLNATNRCPGGIRSRDPYIPRWQAETIPKDNLYSIFFQSRPFVSIFI